MTQSDKGRTGGRQRVRTPQGGAGGGKGLKSPFYEDPYVKIFNGDCLDLLPHLTQSYDLCISDPPWGISGEEDTVINLYEGEKVTGWHWDRFTGNEFWDFTFKWVDATVPLLKDGGHLIVWFDAWKISPLAMYLREKGFRKRQVLQWVKTNTTPQLRGVAFQSSVESAFWFTKEGGVETFNHKLGEQPNYWRLSPGSDGAWFHPTQKPVKLLSTWVSYLTEEGDLILDPMMGSASVGVAAKSLGRFFLGIEKEESYCLVAQKRLAGVSIPMLMEESKQVESACLPMFHE